MNVGAKGTRVPICAFRTAVFSLQWGRNMRVYPKRPERVVEVEHNHLRQWEAVCEGFGGAEFIIEDGG